MQLLLFCYGLVFGSFANVLIDRSDNGESVLWGRSHCDYCNKTLRWFELVPLVSFLIQRGKCRRCKHALSVQYPLIELLTAFSFVVLGWYIPFGLEYIVKAAILTSAIVMVVADYKYQIIPDSMVIVGSSASLLLVLMTKTGSDYVVHLFSAIGSLSFYYALWYFTKGKGMGFGDVKLAGMLGLLLGYPGIIFSHYIAFLTGASVGVILILTKNKSLKSKIAFGPFMLIGLLLTVIFENQLVYFWSKYF